MDVDDRILKLEHRLAANPNDFVALKRLVALLDNRSPRTGHTGAFSNAQAAITRFIGVEWKKTYVNQRELLSAYPEWLKLLRSEGVNQAVPVGQAFSGSVLQVKGSFGHCDKRLKFFKETGAICAVCHDCYKVQILPANLLALFQTHFLLLNLELPRDNARKCMLELREGIRFPYKAYIYCESIEEVRNCFQIFQDAQKDFGVENVQSKISHGCSEYGVKYPDFKYNDDGPAEFKAPESWKGIEEEYFASVDLTDPVKKSNTKSFISLRDVFAFCTWVKYAELIGDDTSNLFTNHLAPALPGGFENRVSMQAQIRNQELKELQRA